MDCLSCLGRPHLGRLEDAERSSALGPSSQKADVRSKASMNSKATLPGPGWLTFHFSNQQDPYGVDRNYAERPKSIRTQNMWTGDALEL